MSPGGLDGVVVVDKPSGPTSFEVVQAVRAALKASKAGHTGTLDPLATGVLPVCLGEATRIVEFLTQDDKSYEALVALGVATDTLDAQGRVVDRRPVPPLDAAVLEAALAPLRGQSTQVPPMYSAVRVGGRRLYELARAGETVARQARAVTVSSLTVVDFSASEVRVRVACSKGYFVRSLAEELGQRLGTVAHLKELRRLSSGPFTLAQAVPLAALQAGASPRLLSVEEALAGLPALAVDEAQARRVGHGGLVEVPAAPAGVFRVLEPGGGLLALAELQAGKLVYRRVFAARTGPGAGPR